jgi:hypothetical protein
VTPSGGTSHGTADRKPAEASSVMCLPPCRRRVTIGNCTLYLGDCAALLPYLERVPGGLTDPPYGLGRISGGSGKHSVQKGAAKTTFDGIERPRPLWLERDDVRACLLYARRVVGHERVDLAVLPEAS